MTTVQVYLVSTGLYMVEFIRGQFDLFQFKRFYEDIRAKLSEIVKNDYTLQVLAQTTASDRGSGVTGGIALGSTVDAVAASGAGLGLGPAFVGAGGRVQI